MKKTLEYPTFFSKFWDFFFQCNFCIFSFFIFNRISSKNEVLVFLVSIGFSAKILTDNFIIYTIENFFPIIQIGKERITLRTAAQEMDLKDEDSKYMYVTHCIQVILLTILNLSYYINLLNANRYVGGGRAGGWARGQGSSL